MMSQKSLLLCALALMSLTHLTACLENKRSDSGRTKLRKGQVNGSLQGQAAKPGQPQGGRAQTSGKPGEPAATAGQNPATPASAETKPGIPGTFSANCQTVQAKAKNLGFKVEQIESSIGGQKLRIHYYVLTKNEGAMKDALLYFKESSFQETTENDLENLKKISATTGFDVVTMDMRGAGCTGGLPSLQAASAELQNFGARGAIQDAELIRRKILKDQKWTILAHRSGGASGLRYVELAPQGLRSLHIADFTPVSDMKKLMAERASQEAANWNRLLKDTKLEESVVEKALTQLDSQKCTDGIKCRDLVHLLASKLGQLNQWSVIKNSFESIAEGKTTAQELLAELQKRKQRAELKVISRMLDLDSDRQLQACPSTLTSSESKSPLSLCRLESLIGLPQVQKWSQAIHHEALNWDRIKNNLNQNKIDYSLSAAGLSTYYPINSYKEQQSKLEEILENSFFQFENLGSDIFLTDDFLKSIKQ